MIESYRIGVSLALDQSGVIGPLADVLAQFERVQQTLAAAQAGIGGMLGSLGGAGEQAGGLAEVLDRAATASARLALPGIEAWEPPPVPAGVVPAASEPLATAAAPAASAVAAAPVQLPRLEALAVPPAMVHAAPRQVVSLSPPPAPAMAMPPAWPMPMPSMPPLAPALWPAAMSPVPAVPALPPTVVLPAAFAALPETAGPPSTAASEPLTAAMLDVAAAPTVPTLEAVPPALSTLPEANRSPAIDGGLLALPAAIDAATPDLASPPAAAVTEAGPITQPLNPPADERSATALLRGLVEAFAGRADGAAAREASERSQRDGLRQDPPGSSAPPASHGAEPLAVHVSVHLDGRQIGEALAHAADGALSGIGDFDGQRNMLATT